MRRIVIVLIILITACAAVASTVKLELKPAKAPKPSNKYKLLTIPEPNDDTDACPFYQKSIGLLPRNLRKTRISNWLKMPPEQLPQEQVLETLENFKSSLQLVKKASKCSKCIWKVPDKLQPDESLTKYRSLTRIIALNARLHIARGNYEQALDTIQTGLSMARHIGQGPTLHQGMVGIAIAAAMLNEIEQLMQMPDAPALYQALKNLPKPFIDLDKSSKAEMTELNSSPQFENNPMLLKLKQKEYQLRNKRIGQITTRLDRRITALQCIEAIRLYAAANDEKFPTELTKITTVPVPVDPVTKKPFAYSLVDSKAVLQEPTDENNAESKDIMRYELTLSK